MAGVNRSTWKQPALWLVVVSVLLGALTVAVGTQKDPSRLAVSLLQGIALVFGTVGSYVLGRDASKEAASDLIRPHARSAFRRVQNLYQALGRQQEAIMSERERLQMLSQQTLGGDLSFEHARASFLALEYMVVEQISTADDALEDWRDLVPDEVRAIEEAGRRREETDGRED